VFSGIVVSVNTRDFGAVLRLRRDATYCMGNTTVRQLRNYIECVSGLTDTEHVRETQGLCSELCRVIVT
jgi:hypothetical protein